MSINDTRDNAEIHDDVENIGSNPTGNRPFADVLSAAISRRTVLQGSLAGATAGFLAPAAAQASYSRYEDGRNRSGELVHFEPVSIERATIDQTLPTISQDYEYQVLAPWGTPIEPGIVEAYEGDPSYRPTAKQAELQVGIGHDGMAFFPQTIRGRKSNERGMLCVNHEFGTNRHVLGKDVPESLEDVRLSQAVHGVSVLQVKLGWRGDWHLKRSRNARRITVNTRVCFTGPAADSPLLQNPDGNVPLGTVNNCGSGTTPWGTYLTCEENFNGYFGWTDDTYLPTEEQQRYGFRSTGFGYGWHLFDKRFDVADPDYVNESNRFGWIVEIDPFDGMQRPAKRTALGRFKHEAIAIKVAEDGRIAAYMGDDERFDYCYKYVSDLPWREARKRGESPLDNGRLYVARFNDDGTGDWLELTIDNPVLAARFENQAEVLIYARIASDLLGATPMDRPEWTTIGTEGEVFWTLTNNSRRTEPNAANPEAPNNDGHIIRTSDEYEIGDRFHWDIYILASSTRGTPGVFTDPDAAYADPFGRLFIGTDGGQPDGLQDQVVVFDTTKETPEPKRLLVGVVSDEITGWAYTPNFRTAFTNIQHPGNGDPTATNFPLPFDGHTIPRDATVVIMRKDRGVVGS